MSMNWEPRPTAEALNARRGAVKTFRAGARWLLGRLLEAAWACIVFYGALALLRWLSAHPFNLF